MADTPEPIPTDETTASDLRANRAVYISAADLEAQRARTQRRLMLGLRLLYVVLLVIVALIPLVGRLSGDEAIPFQSGDVWWIAAATFIFAVMVLTLDAATPNKRLSAIFAVFLGIGAGIAGSIAAAAVLDLIWETWSFNENEASLAYLDLLKFMIGISLCYLAVSIVLTTKDDFRLVIPYVEFSKQVRGVRPMALDTSVLIDGRIEGYSETGFLDAPLVLPQFVIQELQALADSRDKHKRSRGKRGLAVVSRLQHSPFINISIDETAVGGSGVDEKLVQLAAQQNLRILTTDYNLNQVAQIQNVAVLNINDLSNVLKTEAIAGDELSIEIIREGEGDRQGIGYMPDGTMVVVEDAADSIGQTVPITVTNSLQTSAGKMIFGRRNGGPGPSPSNGPRMAEMATSQPRTPLAEQRSNGAEERQYPPPRRQPGSARNPRR